MTRTQQSLQRLSRIRNELDAAHYALSRAEVKWDTEAGAAPAHFRRDVTLTEVRRAKENLDRTFILRIFAEFEGILLDYWKDALRRTTKPKVSVLIGRIADSCPTPINNEFRDNVHLVRHYRNSLVHSHAEAAAALTVAECLSRFGKYISHFPQNW